MKILLCVDGSLHSTRVVDETVRVAGGCSADEVSVINVCENTPGLPRTASDRHPFTREDIESFDKLGEQEKIERKKKLKLRLKSSGRRGIKVETVLECGRPADVIARYAEEGGFDMIAIGSRGLERLKKLLLGSVSNSVLQEARCSVGVVK